MRRSVDFERTVRRGTRAGRPTLVVHLLTTSGEAGNEPPQVGFVVSKAVGNAVRRNLVKRRLRASAAGHLGQVPSGACVVVRALAPSATASYQDLDTDLGSSLARAVKKAVRGTRDGGQPLAGTEHGVDAGSARRPTTTPGYTSNGGTAA
ncbi:hypothetical protein GCM10009751_22070 [Myceligenerans crystallogenes]|uniref:Ribonuclease P protein component n=1 Tax=Myceligenerans crystallogenes TaxID=316335 RepID=A0ABN2NF69_9MICO